MTRPSRPLAITAAVLGCALGATSVAAEDAKPLQKGAASWYGPGFHGKRTANGEVYDENGLTAAHKTLPMPAMVRVTNLENGRSIQVRINDRGPFEAGRVIDMTRRGAQLLGFIQQGTARVRVDIMPEESQQLAVDLILMCCRDTVRRTRIIDFFRACNDSGRLPRRVFHWNNLVILTVQH